jgi:hypothetical protein
LQSERYDIALNAMKDRAALRGLYTNKLDLTSRGMSINKIIIEEHFRDDDDDEKPELSEAVDE